MDIYAFGDEPGTFDPLHYEHYAFGGLIFLEREAKDSALRKYLAAERAIAGEYPRATELKASALSPKHKLSLFRATDRAARFAVVIRQELVDQRIVARKKVRQRYLDYAFRSGIESWIASSVEGGLLPVEAIDDLLVTFDNHKTATYGRYELQESLAEDLKDGIVTRGGGFIEPSYPDMGDVRVKFTDSRANALVRATDIIANVALHKALEGKLADLEGRMQITVLL